MSIVPKWKVKVKKIDGAERIIEIEQVVMCFNCLATM